jgi:hypothetical protein
MKSSSARRRNYRWTDAEIDQLVEWHALNFVPATPRGTLKALSQQRQRTLMKDLAKHLSDGTIGKIKREAESLRRRMPTIEDLPPKMLDAAERSLPDESNFTMVVNACAFLAASLGYAVESPPRNASRRMSIADRRWFWLSVQRQKDMFLEWTELYEDVWNSPAWRECMQMRYGKKDRKTLMYLSPSDRRGLKAEAERLKRDIGPDLVSNDQLNSAAAKIGRGKFMGAVHHILRKEYVRVRVLGKIEQDHWLNKPISKSGFFERVAEPEPDTSKMHEALQDSFELRFCRYLCAPSDSADALLGEVLYSLVRLDSGLWQRPLVQPPELPGVVWPSQLSPRVEEPTHDFALIAHCLTKKLKLRSTTFDLIWSTYITLTMRRFWEKRASVSMMIYWAARILEGLRPDVYRFYGKWIDFFHVNILRPFMKITPDSRNDFAVQRSALEPFLHALIRDPLLNSVFHSEVLDGRKRLFPRQEPRRKDNRIRMQMIVCTVQFLHAIHPHQFEESIQDLLDENISIQKHVRYASQPSARHLRTGGRSLYAYASPLVAAMFDDPHWLLTADTVKEIYHRHKDDPEVELLLRDTQLKR